MRLAHAQARAPVILLGTSQGAIAAMNGAAHAAPASINGVVLSESVSVMGGSGETVFDADPDKVRVPALVVASTGTAATAARSHRTAITASRPRWWARSRTGGCPPYIRSCPR
ncbi:hypothetical protein [Novosphingobium sp. Leaf2]|uniref:hypothetical protein n=1 Tax=Novosphingobium sp. Leaf2 TaxID=1735670 RepID=UPI000AD72F73|nr:hypothetical protein [Novosphingobium sp. Leaf2]